MARLRFPCLSHTYWCFPSGGCIGGFRLKAERCGSITFALHSTRRWRFCYILNITGAARASADVGRILRSLEMPAQFQRVANQTIGNLFLRRVAEGEQFSRLFYEEVRFLRRSFRRCTWSDCRFRRTHFQHGTRFDGCLFQGCEFDRAHTYIGGPSRFRDCKFEACSFDSVQFWKTSFERCSFASKFRNIVFYGPDAPAGWQTEFIEVDFSSAEFDLVDFRCGIDLSTTSLPPGFVPPNVPCSPPTK